MEYIAYFVNKKSYAVFGGSMGRRECLVIYSASKPIY